MNFILQTPTGFENGNARHFPDDPVWQRHCKLIERFRAADLRPVAVAEGMRVKLLGRVS